VVQKRERRKFIALKAEHYEFLRNSCMKALKKSSEAVFLASLALAISVAGLVLHFM